MNFRNRYSFGWLVAASVLGLASPSSAREPGLVRASEILNRTKDSASAKGPGRVRLRSAETEALPPGSPGRVFLSRGEGPIEVLYQVTRPKSKSRRRDSSDEAPRGSGPILAPAQSNLPPGLVFNRVSGEGTTAGLQIQSSTFGSDLSPSGGTPPSSTPPATGGGVFRLIDPGLPPVPIPGSQVLDATIRFNEMTRFEKAKQVLMALGKAIVDGDLFRFRNLFSPDSTQDVGIFVNGLQSDLNNFSNRNLSFEIASYYHTAHTTVVTMRVQRNAQDVNNGNAIVVDTFTVQVILDTRNGQRVMVWGGKAPFGISDPQTQTLTVSAGSGGSTSEVDSESSGGTSQGSTRVFERTFLLNRDSNFFNDQNVVGIDLDTGNSVVAFGAFSEGLKNAAQQIGPGLDLYLKIVDFSTGSSEVFSVNGPGAAANVTGVPELLGIGNGSAADFCPHGFGGQGPDGVQRVTTPLSTNLYRGVTISGPNANFVEHLVFQTTEGYYGAARVLFVDPDPGGAIPRSMSISIRAVIQTTPNQPILNPANTIVCP